MTTRPSSVRSTVAHRSAPVRVLARLVVVLVALCAAAVALPRPAGPVGAQDRPRPAEPGSGAPEPTIRLVSQTTLVEPDGSFVAYFEVSDAPDGSDLAIDIYPVLDTEERLRQALDGEPTSSDATFPVVELPPAAGEGSVRTGFEISLAGRSQALRPGGWSKRLTRAGAYPIRVRLRGPDNTNLQTLVTFLVRTPEADEEVEPAPVALVPRITSGIDAEAALDDPDGPLDEERSNAIASLADTLAAHPTVPASLAVSADVARRLAAAVETSAGPADGQAAGETDSTIDDGPDDQPDGSAPRTTAGSDTTDLGTDGGVDGSDGSGGSTDEEGDGSGADSEVVEESTDALGRLRAVLEPTHRELLGAPFVDVDPAATVAAGLDDELARQSNLGFRDLADALEPPMGDLWRVDHRLDAEAVDALAALEVTRLLLPPGAIIGEPPARWFRIAGANDESQALVARPGLTLGGNEDPELAAVTALAHLVARGAMSPGATQVLTAPLPRTVDDVAELDAVLALLADDNPFIDPTTLSDVFGSTPGAEDRVDLRTPETPDPGRYPAELTEANRLLGAYASMVGDRLDLVDPLAEALALAGASGLSPTARTGQVHRVRDVLDAELSGVTIPSSDRVTLGARDAQFPLIVRSDSDVPLRVVVEMSSASDRLTVVEDRTEVLLEGDRTVVPVRVHSRSPGDTPVRIRVTSADGHVVLSEGSYSVRSTAVSGVGLVLTVGAGVFLAAWWGRHWVRARRAKDAAVGLGRRRKGRHAR